MIKQVKLAKELVLVTEHRVGVLRDVARLLADKGIDVIAISAQAAGGAGLINIVVDDTLRAKDLLRKKKYPVHENTVILVSVEDKPGTLLRLTKKLAAARADILNIYGSAPDSYAACTLVISTNNNQKAVVALKK